VGGDSREVTAVKRQLLGLRGLVLLVLIGNAKGGHLFGGVPGCASEHGIGVHVGGTASAPSFKLDSSTVAGLLGSGVGHALDENPASGALAPSPRISLLPRQLSHRCRSPGRGVQGARWPQEALEIHGMICRYPNLRLWISSRQLGARRSTRT
jgi:hypothetical protein